MFRILVVFAHPIVEIEKSNSLIVAWHFIEKVRELEPTAAIEKFELYGNDIPVVDDLVLGAWDKKAKGEDLNEDEQKVLTRMNHLLDNFKWANRYVFVFPLYNFNIPSKLKDYLDNVLIAKETFAYGDDGPVGLLNDGRKVLVIQSSDAVYSKPGWYADHEFSHKYMKMISSFVGIEDYTIVRAEGGGVYDREVILKRAKEEVEAVAKDFVAPPAPVTAPI
ncbi:FMN-dependent NADH-azoreductase [Paenibacillus aestuarii]|uniref:FMN dependent NADH:quinone oxidoreductase n=1 Tax=Paenibacillus aestuarii TaxID=516965 RepID=A0ABW0K5K4_9BACL|nr:NAD(P)H-dependent oxidoreductase [Paenibacillus aestuarii]